MSTRISILKEYYDTVSAHMKPKDAQLLLSHIEQIVEGAILDPSENIRTRLIKNLEEIFSDLLKSGFAADGQLYLVLGYEGKRGMFFICDMPKTYAGSKTKPHRFDIR